MNQLPLACLLSALALAASAQTPPPPETVRVPAALPQIVLPERHYVMSTDEFLEFKGSYTLSNGQHLQLYNRGYAMFAQVEHQGPHRLVASAANAFVATDRQLKMRIDIHDDGTVEGELTMVVPSAPLAGADGAQRLQVATLH